MKSKRKNSKKQKALTLAEILAIISKGAKDCKNQSAAKREGFITVGADGEVKIALKKRIDDDE